MRVRGIQSGFDFLTAARGLRDQREPLGVRFGRVLRQGLPDRPVEYAARRAPRHRAGDDHGHARRHRPAVAELSAALALHARTSRCFATCRCCCSFSSGISSSPNSCRRSTRRCSRCRASSSARTACSIRFRSGRRVTSGWSSASSSALSPHGTGRSSRAAGSRPRGVRRPSSCPRSGSSSAWRSSAGSRAARRRRSTFRRRPRSPSSAAAPSRRNS